MARNTSDFIKEQIEKLKRDIEQKEETLQEYSQREDIVMMDEREDIIVQHFEALNRELTQAQAERVEAEAHYQSLRNAGFEAFAEIFSDATVQNLKRQHAELQTTLAELESRFKPGYPDVRRTKDALADVEMRLNQEMEVVANGVLAGARVRYQAARNRENLLRRTLEQQRQETRDLNQLAAGYRRSKMELDNQNAVLEQLLRRQSETGLSAEMGQRESLMTVRLVDEAVVPTLRHSPRVLLNLAVGTMLGALLAMGLAFFLHHWDTALHNQDDVRRHLALPVLGVIPHVVEAEELFQDDENGEGQSVVREAALAVVEGGAGAPGSGGEHSGGPSANAILAERFKFVRSSLLLSSGDATPKTVLVTSSIQDEGKTFVACRLAKSFVELGMRVLLVDADLRRPSLQNVFHLKNRLGLTTLLVDGGHFDTDCIARTPAENFSLLLAGPRCTTPAELLSSKAIDVFLQEANEKFDIVLMDSSPLLPVVDSQALVGLADAVVMVVRSGRTSRQSVTMSKDLIGKRNGKIAGAVLNDVDFGDYAYSYYYGSQSYTYGGTAGTSHTESA